MLLKGSPLVIIAVMLLLPRPLSQFVQDAAACLLTETQKRVPCTGLPSLALSRFRIDFKTLVFAYVSLNGLGLYELLQPHIPLQG